MSAFSRRRLLRLALAGAVAAPLAACGKRGPLEPPLTEQERIDAERRAAGDPDAPRASTNRAAPLPAPRRDTPFDFLL